MIVRLAAGFGADVPMTGVVPKLSRTPGQIRSVGPALGEHTDAVLRDARRLHSRRGRGPTGQWRRRVDALRRTRSAARSCSAAARPREQLPGLAVIVGGEGTRRRAELDHDPVGVVGVDRRAPAVIDAHDVETVREPAVALVVEVVDRPSRTRCGSRSSADRARSRSQDRSRAGSRRAGPRSRASRRCRCRRRGAGPTRAPCTAGPRPARARSPWPRCRSGGSLRGHGWRWRRGEKPCAHCGTDPGGLARLTAVPLDPDSVLADPIAQFRRLVRAGRRRPASASPTR